MKLLKFMVLLVLINTTIIPLAAKEITFDKQILSIEGHSLTVEVAKTESQRQLGLMNRESLAKDRGMLFILDKNDRICFWMKNTLIPLSIAFINQHNLITQIEDMQPLSNKLVCSHDKILYGLEVNQGWFADNKIDIGMTVDGINHSAP